MLDTFLYFTRPATWKLPRGKSSPLSALGPQISVGAKTGFSRLLMPMIPSIEAGMGQEYNKFPAMNGKGQATPFPIFVIGVF